MQAITRYATVIQQRRNWNLPCYDIPTYGQLVGESYGDSDPKQRILE